MIKPNATECIRRLEKCERVLCVALEKPGLTYLEKSATVSKLTEVRKRLEALTNQLSVA